MSRIYGMFTGSHSPCIAYLEDGEIIFSIEEERLTRIKAGDNYDIQAEMCLNRAELETNVKFHEADYRVIAQPVPDEFLRRISKGKPYERVSHHTAHAYGAYFTSGFEGKTITITYDGGGQESVMKIFLCEDGKMTLVKNMPYAGFASLSHLWGFSTSSMRGYDEHNEGKWKMCKDEGKLMGMAPDGFYDEKIYKILNSLVNYENLRFFPSGTAPKTQFICDMMFEDGFFESQINKEMFCFNLQKLTNDLMLRFINDLHKLYPEYTKLCFAGGLFANVKLNQHINELPWVEEVYILPPMGDEGLALGAAIFKSVELGEWTKPKRLKNVFLGSKYSEEKIQRASTSFNFKRREYDVKEMARKIADGNIVGWFQGGSELGPRALGARSILVKPTDKETHKILNGRLKRYDTMPFAPIVMSEHFDEIFTCSKSKYTAQFMTMCYSTKEEWIDKIPAVIQKSDKTARPQVVVKESNPKFWEILNEYYLITGIPVLLNTSFNSHNEPIIEHPRQAFETLYKKIIDELILEDYVYYSE